MSDLPIGGTTGLSHEHTGTIEEAAAWLASQPMWPSPIVPALNAIFGLSAVDACAAIREARLQHGRAM